MVLLNLFRTGAFPVLLKICHIGLMGPVWADCIMKCIKLKVLGWLISKVLSIDVKAKGLSAQKGHPTIPLRWI